ncbi:uncharacterized protein LY89DRAFT_666510 [Mollisia scopiformis]|uniref:Uncharacterized protein n=1 Tax=Mollisia scopiformis TaxID=149040 RepID=A0A194XHF2_MOLSC|nr:uncharacterized protein LY89DRAFT_666510 [Mollisia scopiformis]KUJ19640.1 hypothetical protein LY89DRAFT_666510 [Mollisia scopiformis]
MANAMFDVLPANQSARGIPIEPSSLAFKIGSLTKSTNSSLYSARYYPTTIQHNAAFLEFVSHQTALEARVSLEDWASYLNQTQWERTKLDPQDIFAVLDALVCCVKSGLENSLRIQRSYRDENQILFLVQQMRIKILRCLGKADLGREMADEEELVMLMQRT